MRTITLVVAYVLSFIAFFYILSLIGLLFADYKTVVSSQGWKGTYCMFLGWWLAFLPAREVYIQSKWDLGL